MNQTNLNTLASRVEDASGPEGTFACPICGHDQPHYHPDEQVAAYRADSARDDGWISTKHRQPKKSGWYLCAGVKIDPDQCGAKKDFQTPDDQWSQLSWLKWVRDIGALHLPEHEIQEVLYFDGRHGGSVWRLRNFLGIAVISGAEARFPVRARPEYWRDLPEPPQ